MNARLEFSAVRKAFGRHQVLDCLWLKVRSGEVVGLLGANGAGKTTLLRIAAGLMRPDGGSVRWPEVPSGPALAIRYFGGEMTLPSHVSARSWASIFGVVSAERRPIGRLSRGHRQLLGLRVLLAGPPAPILLLDEPWEGLDPPGAKWLTDTLRHWSQAGSAILVSSHRLYDLDSVCTRFVMLEAGRCRPLVEPLAEENDRPRLEMIEQAFTGRGQP